MRSRALLCCCLLAAAGPLCAQENQPPPRFFEAIQAGNGILWARDAQGLYRFDGAEWRKQESPFASSPEAVIIKLAKMPDGAMACLWRLSEHEFGVTRHTEADARVLGTCHGDIPERDGSPSQQVEFKPLSAAANGLWITGSFPQIYRVDGHGGGVSLVHELTSAELSGPHSTDPHYNRLQAVEDGRGRMWVWSLPQAQNYSGLRGVLICTGAQVEHHEQLSTLKTDSGICTMIRADDRHLWVSVRGEGIYRLDIDSLALEPAPQPADPPSALRDVHELYAQGNDLYAVAEAPRFRNSLWRLRDRQWTQLISHFDRHSNPSWQPRNWLPIPQGLLVETMDGAPWFVPAEGSPAQYSWRSGFPLLNSHALTRLADGSYFALNREGQIFHGNLAMPPGPEAGSRVSEIDANRSWIVDHAGRPWMILDDSTGSLSEWDGEKWVAHAIPGENDQCYPAEIDPDAEGRIWVTSNTNQHAVHVYDPATGHWDSFPGLRAAYLALREHPPHLLENDDWKFSPVYSADGRRAAYRRGVTDLNYYDGSAWQELNRYQITGRSDDTAVGPPWFDEEDRLCVNLRPRMTWHLGDDGKWSEMPYRSHYPADIWSQDDNRRFSTPSVPPGCVTASPDSIVRDNLGTYWLMWQRELYKCIPGRCVKVFAPGEVHPFHSGRSLRKVFVDARGNAFVLSSGSSMEALIIRPHSPPPLTAITVEATGSDGVRVHLATDSASAVEFAWALDAEPWQATSHETLTLDSLPNGLHQLSVRATDAELQSEVLPAVASFEVHVDSDRQIGDLIGRLSDPDYERRAAAIEGLGRQPALALPKLRAVRVTAGDDLRWWIDAALQQCERQAAAVPK